MIREIKAMNEDYKKGYLNIGNYIFTLIIVIAEELNRFCEDVVEYKIATVRRKFFQAIIDLANFPSKVTIKKKG